MKKYKVIKNIRGHGFEIGEIVKRADSNVFSKLDGSEWWHMYMLEVELLEEETTVFKV